MSDDSLSNIKKFISNSFDYVANSIYQNTNIEILKIKKYLIIREFQKKVKQNKMHNLLTKEKENLQTLILNTNQQISHYDFKIAEINFEIEKYGSQTNQTNQTTNITNTEYDIKDLRYFKDNYQKIFNNLKTFADSLQYTYGNIITIPNVSDEDLDNESIIYETNLKLIDEEIEKACNILINLEKSTNSNKSSSLKNNTENEIEFVNIKKNVATDIKTIVKTNIKTNIEDKYSKSFEEICEYTHDCVEKLNEKLNE